MNTQANAGDVLFQRVFVPEFVKAATARGYAPANDADLAEMIKIAMELSKYESQAPAQASVSPLLKAASDSLSVLTGSQSPVGAYLADPEVAAALSA